ncbi:MAG: RNA polymerase sigma factor [Armatimonadota bacterium]|nr:RNA polymerase sigma factor [Armatimonadota bacterium]
METRDLRAETQTGERGAADFRALYAQHGDRVYRFCFRLCGQAAEAEDLTQDVFIAAWQGLGRFEGRSSALTWLLRIALYRWRRVRGERRTAAPDDRALEAADDHADPARIGLRRLSLAAALAELPDDLHDAFLLVKAEGLKYREAAQVLDTPQGTVQWRVSEAARRLRLLLTDSEDQEEIHHAL